jgi:hypothetical protein
MKVYQGTRTDHGVAIVVEENGEFRSLDPRHDLRSLSSEGFEWGDGSRGSLQLALALAADVLVDDDKAQNLYQRLIHKLVGRLPDDGWVLTENRIRAVIDAIENAKTRSR